ncbi:MAG: fluoride efflux transporter CrcB [Thioalkalivibrio sp.]|nr:fluoride efflux transporter CrcB [Thioalkalivibrio sp.]
MQDLAWVMLGCALGGMARLWVSNMVAHRFGEAFPWGTLVVNVTGAFVIGIFAAAAASGEGWFGEPTTWLFAGIGFLGSYTTVSAFSLQTLLLMQNGQRWRAAGNLALSFGLCLPAAALGLVAGTVLTAMG